MPTHSGESLTLIVSLPTASGTVTPVMRQLGIVGAVLLGLGGMVGAGVFAGFAPAAATAGYWVLPALILPAVLAYCSAVSSAALATACPGVGGGYLATAESLGEWPGRITGVLFVAGTSAALAAVAGVLGEYLLPAQPKVVAFLVIALVVLVNGLRLADPAAARAILVTRVLLVVVLAVLIIVVVSCFAVPPVFGARLGTPAPVPNPLPNPVAGSDIRGFPAAAGIMYFAFSGFERFAGRGDGGPITDRTRRIVLPLLVGSALLLYLAVGFALLHQLGRARLGLSPTPLLDALDAADAAALRPLVLLAAASALLPVAVWLHGGVRDVLRAMHTSRDLRLPWIGTGRNGAFDAVAGALAAIIVVPLTPAAAMVFAVTCVLAYSMFANASARVLLREEHPWPTRTACVGMVLSVVLVMTLPVGDLAAVLAICGVGVALTAVSARRARYRSRL